MTEPIILSPLFILPLILVTFKVLDSGFQPFSDTTAVVSFPMLITSPSTYSTFSNFGLNAAKSPAFITLPKIYSPSKFPASVAVVNPDMEYVTVGSADALPSLTAMTLKNL